MGVEVGSPLARQPAHPPPPPEIKHLPHCLVLVSLPTSSPSSVLGGSTTPLASSQDFYILFGMSDPSQLPLHEGQTLRGVCAHLIMPVYLLS